MLSACLGLPKKAPAARPQILSFPKGDPGVKREPRLVGKISMVNSQGRFVLIDCDLWSMPESGTALKCFRYGAETGILSTGSERRGAQVVADIVKGEPQRGDEVFE